MKKNLYQFISLVIVTVFGVTLFFIATDGFTAFTEETARTKKLVEERPRLPKLTLQDSKEREYSFDKFKNKFILITFIYTSCTTLCPQLEENMAEIYAEIPKKYIGKDIVFLSISFDPNRDTPEVLERYQTYFGSDGETWRMARIPNEVELQSILDEFGVIVIPEGEGDFQHNVAFYLVNRKGSLIDVLDFSDIKNAQNKILSVLNHKD